MNKKNLLLILILVNILLYHIFGDTLWPRCYYKAALAVKTATGNSLSQPNMFLRNIIDIANNFGDVVDAWKSNPTKYDVNIYNMVLKYASDMMAAPGEGFIWRQDRNIIGAFLGSDVHLEEGQVTRHNLGLSGVYTLAEGTYSVEGLMNWLDIAQTLKDKGLSTEEIECYISVKIYEYYGDYSKRAGEKACDAVLVEH